MTIFENKIVSIILSPFALIYFLVIFFRNKLYDWSILKSSKLPCRVISVGNLTVGGTGKTPVVEYLANYLKNKGKKIVIISRGYKRKTRGLQIVSDGTNILSTPEDSGDEPYLLALKLKGVPVIVDIKKERAGYTAWKKFKPEIVILDDGFQYRRLHRDVDIVLFDDSILNKNKSLLPSGPYREPLSSISRAQIIWFTKTNLSTDSNKLNSKITFRKPEHVIHSKFIPERLVHFKSRQAENLTKLTGKRVFVFCGIGNPNSFFRTLDNLGAETVGEKIFRDHHLYTKEDINRIIQESRDVASDWIVTTEKDWVNLPKDAMAATLSLYFLEMKLELFTQDFHLVRKIFGNI
jgi:tetraacyldisaccharide 4'-kinase